MSESTLWLMLFLESIVSRLGDSKFWFKLDVFKGFWLMPLAEECQEIISFMIDRAIFTPRRSTQGALNSATLWTVGSPHRSVSPSASAQFVVEVVEEINRFVFSLSIISPFFLSHQSPLGTTERSTVSQSCLTTTFVSLFHSFYIR